MKCHVEGCDQWAHWRLTVDDLAPPAGSGPSSVVLLMCGLHMEQTLDMGEAKNTEFTKMPEPGRRQRGR